MKLKLIIAMLPLAIMSNIAEAATLDFANASPLDPLTTYSEDGYTVSSDQGKIVFEGGFNGAPTTHLLSGGYTDPLTTYVASFDVMMNGALFNFLSFDYLGSGAGNYDFADYTITGYVAGTRAFQQTFSDGNASYKTFLSGSSTIDIDRLNIATSAWSVRLDNIAVTPAVPPAVPEPATWAMMIGGFGVMGATLRRRRRVAAAA